MGAAFIAHLPVVGWHTFCAQTLSLPWSHCRTVEGFTRHLNGVCVWSQ